MPKLNDKKVEELLTAYLEKGPMPLEGLLRIAVTNDSLDWLQGERVLKDMALRGIVEFNGGWYRLVKK